MDNIDPSYYTNQYKAYAQKNHEKQTERDLLSSAEQEYWDRYITPKAPGLSTAHIFSQHEDFIPGHAEFYDNGDLVTVRKPRMWSRFEEPKGGGKRGEVTVFSKPSQRRLQRSLAKVDKQGPKPLFATLTYPDEYPIGGSIWKRHLKNLWQRLARKYPEAAFFWVLELKKRKSGTNEGEYAPHFHLIVFGIPVLEFLVWVAHNWYEVVGSGNEDHLSAGTSVEVIRSWRRIGGYVSKATKYLTKAEVEDIPEDWHIGRFWGVYGRKNVPWADKWICRLTKDEVNRLIRYLRRYAGIKGRDYQSLTVICDSNQWSDRLEDLLYPT